MSKRVVIIRHAKSSWAELGQPDFDRPLNSRGKENAPEMGRRLLQYGLQPDAIYASTAKRAKQTAMLIATAIGFKEEIHWDRFLYHAAPDRIEAQICGADDAYDTIYIVAHNPGITEMVNEAIPGFTTDNVPTCGVVAFSVAADKWTEYPQARKQLMIYDYPKNNSIDV